MDASGIKLEELTAADVESVLEAFPRLGFKKAAIQTIIALCQKKPLAQMLHPFAEVGRRHIPNLMIPTVEDLTLSASFAE